MKTGIFTLLTLLSLSAYSHLKKEFEFTSKTSVKGAESMQMMRLNLTIVVPPTMFPKKTFIELLPSLFGYQFKSIAIQGLKSGGNALTISEKTGGTLVYSDYIPFEAGMRDNEGDGHLLISQTSNKGKVLQSSLTLKRNKDMRYYFDASQSRYLTITMDYVFEVI